MGLHYLVTIFSFNSMSFFKFTQHLSNTCSFSEWWKFFFLLSLAWSVPFLKFCVILWYNVIISKLLLNNQKKVTIFSRLSKTKHQFWTSLSLVLDATRNMTENKLSARLKQHKYDCNHRNSHKIEKKTALC